MLNAFKARMLSRRHVIVGATSLGAAGPAMAAGGFPPGFLWGVAASAPQTEGAAGRAASIWDVFAQRPGVIADGSDLSVGTAFETRYAEDIGLAADAGLKGFRFSIAWPRVQPQGSGPANPAGLDFYDRVVDTMLARGVQPWPTLFHWDLPAALPGGWLNRDTTERLADYAVIVGRRLGDRIPAIMVLNEPGVVAILGHALGKHAPGLASRPAWAAATHHQNLAQGLAFAALRSVLPRTVRIGTALSLQPCRPSDPGDEEAARIFDDAWNRSFLDPLFGRGYPARFAPDLTSLIRKEDMRHIAAKPDFVGVNYYDRMYMTRQPASVLGVTWGASPPGTPVTGMGWAVQPDGLLEQLRILRDAYGNPEVLITENGAYYPDPPAKGGVIADPQRIGFLRGHIQAAAQACAEGCALRGMFAWTLTDNFEWAEGYGPKFGLVAVDRSTLKRTPKESLAWLGRVARR